jgi:hypothetical protein
MEYPAIDRVFGVMPPHVHAALHRNGTPEIHGFRDPELRWWLNTSTLPEVESWRNDLRAWSALALESAIREQQKMNAIASALYADSTKGLIRHKAVIHPVIKGWMEHFSKGAWTDRAAIRDTERKHPKFFFNNEVRVCG